MYARGYHGDLNETLFVGEVSQKAKDLVANTWECLEKAITECVKPGTKYRSVSANQPVKLRRTWEICHFGLPVERSILLRYGIDTTWPIVSPPPPPLTRMC